MKKVVKVEEDGFVLDDGSKIELLFGHDFDLTLEEAQKIYEKSLKAVNDLLKESTNEAGKD